MTKLTKEQIKAVRELKQKMVNEGLTVNKETLTAYAIKEALSNDKTGYWEHTTIIY